MTLDEAIEMCENVVIFSSKEYEQIVEWLEELKKYREMNIVHCKDCIHWGTGIAGETENVKCCEYGKYMVGANGYCVYGEKECAEGVKLNLGLFVEVII